MRPERADAIDVQQFQLEAAAVGEVLPGQAFQVQLQITPGALGVQRVAAEIGVLVRLDEHQLQAACGVRGGRVGESQCGHQGQRGKSVQHARHGASSDGSTASTRCAIELA